MLQYSHGRLGRHVNFFRRQVADGSGLPFADHLCPQQVQRVIDRVGVGVRACVFSPMVTVYVFLTQVLSKDHSCRCAVARLLAWLVAQRCKTCSPDTGPYCKARTRLPECVPAELAREVGGDLHQRVACASLLGGRPIKIVDGTTVSMPDTPANQKAYPQSNTQKPGLGFPIARMAVLISLPCGAVLDMAAEAHDVQPRQISFAGTLQTLEVFADVMRLTNDADDWLRMYRALLQAIAHHRVGQRPNRCEPRAVKRRPKPIALLNTPRKQARCRVTKTT